MVIRRAALAALCLLASACMTRPLNGDRLAATNQAVTFEGYWVEPSATVTIQYTTAKAGKLRTLTTTTSAAQGYNVNGQAMYPWSASAVIPHWHQTSCGNHEVFVRARVGNAALPSFDAANVSGGQSGVQCAADLIADGENPIDAAYSCASDDSPLVRLLAGTATHAGSVTISSQAEADALECYTTIDGSLTVADDSTELAIALPHLQTVTDDLTIVYSQVPGGFYTEVRDVSLPVLTTVNGDVALSYPGAPGDNASFDVGLDALTSVGGSLSFELETFNATLHGLTALTELGGDLSLFSSGDDFHTPTLLNALEVVHGDVELTSGNTTNLVLRALTTIDGSLTVTGCAFAMNETNFQHLTSVGGDVSLISMGLQPVGANPHHLRALAQVGGSLHIEDVNNLTDLDLGDPAGLSVGALLLHENFGLEALSEAALSVAPAGAITITNNPLLCPEVVEGFVAAQTLAGWAGMATLTGNDCP